MVRLLLVLLILSSTPLHAQDKLYSLHSSKLSTAVASKAHVPQSIAVLVRDTSSFLLWLNSQYPELKPRAEGNLVYRIGDCTTGQIAALTQCTAVLFIDQGPRMAKEETVLGDFDMTLNAVAALHDNLPEVDGEDITISVKEKPFDPDDLDLHGRVVLNEHFDEPKSLHATIVATVAAGGGNISGEGKGVAPAALLTSSDFELLLPDDGAALLSQGISIQNHSYGVGVENYYGIESFAYDASVVSNPQLVHVFSSGNDGDQTPGEGKYEGIPGVANLTGQFKLSKNTLCVGSSDRYGRVMSRSSRGPAHDGRIKPEVIAFGDGGSSEGAALVSGLVAAIQHQYKTLHNELPNAALVKAVIINSADDVNRPNVDYETGFGSVNALRAVRTVKDGRFFTGEVEEGNTLSVAIQVPAGIHQLKITLAWNDVPGDPTATKALVNDLDLSVTSPSSEIVLPWVLNPTPNLNDLQAPSQRGKDTLNNVEQVSIVNPEAGSYNVVINGADLIATQQFYIAYEFLAGFSFFHPLPSSPLRSASNNIIRWRWHASETNASLDFRYQGNDDWHLISSDINMINGFHDWVSPDTSALIQLRFTTDESEVFISDEILLHSLVSPDLGYLCGSNALLYWPPMENATGFNVYALGEQYMEPIHFTTDTLFAIDTTLYDTRFYAVAPVIGDRIGDRASITDLTRQGVGCYIKSFLARTSVVNEKAVFDLELGTTYGLKSVSLERGVGGGQFVLASSSTDLRSGSFLLADPAFLSGLQTYRVRLEKVSGEMVYSDEEQVLFINENDVYLYPNPAMETDEVSIIIQDESVTRMEVYDLRGTFHRTYEDFGVLKNIEPVAFPPGLYVVELTTSNGKRYHARLIIQ
ncbi:MAG TPA: S8 family peptidase [Chryseosolibacter sp.]|nr:S8 family peptidase [Chryseosolibacter sp.]